MKTRIVFFGSSIHSLPALKKLIENNYEIVGIVTQPDRPTGRKQIITPTPVSLFADSKGIIILKPDSNKSTPWEYSNPNEVVKTILEFKPELLIVCYYGQKIPNQLIEKVKHGGVNIHPSLLPKYRGAAPVEWAIINGESEVGVSIVTLSEEFDQGQIITQQKYPISSNQNPEDIYTELFELGAEMLIKILPDYLENKIDLKYQDNSKAIPAPRLTKEDGKINWNEKPEVIERKIRAFTPWPGSFTFVKLNGQSLRLKILKAHLDKNSLLLDEVQLEGKKPVRFEDFKKAHPGFKFL